MSDSEKVGGRREPAQFPVKDGVEVRTFGKAMRPVRMHARDPYKAGDKFSYVTDVFFTDAEHGDALIPHVQEVHFLATAVPGGYGGRLVRSTNDVVYPAADGTLERGRSVVPDRSRAMRPVSEPFFLSGVHTHTNDEFNACHRAAKEAADALDPEPPGEWS